MGNFAAFDTQAWSYVASQSDYAEARAYRLMNRIFEGGIYKWVRVRARQDGFST